MKKFMVIDCCEREIGEPEFFDTMLKARIRMFEMFFEVCKHAKLSRAIQRLFSQASHSFFESL